MQPDPHVNPPGVNPVHGVYAIPYGIPQPVAGAHFRSDLVAVVPPPPTRAQFEQIVKQRHIIFSSSMYFRQSWLFVKTNMCTLVSGLLCYVLLLGLLELINVRIIYLLLPIKTVHSSHPTSTPGTDEDSMYYFHDDGSVNTKALTVPTHIDIYVERSILRTILSLSQSIFILIPIHVSAILTIFDAMRYNHIVMLSDLLGRKMTRQIYGRLMPLASILTIAYNILIWIFIIPGTLFAWYTIFSLPLFVDHGHYTSAWENIKISAKLVHRYTCSLFLFWFQWILVQLLGLMACGVGIFISTCVSLIAWIYCYHHILPITGVTIWVPRSSPALVHMLEAPPAENPYHHHHHHPQPAHGIAVAIPIQPHIQAYAPAAYPVHNIQDHDGHGYVDPYERQPMLQSGVPPHAAIDAL